MEGDLQVYAVCIQILHLYYSLTNVSDMGNTVGEGSAAQKAAAKEQACQQALQALGLN